MAVNILQKNIRNKMDVRGWNVQETSKKSGVPVGTVKNIIYGVNSDQRIATLQKLAIAFECSVGDLIGENNKSNDSHLLFRECIEYINDFIERKKLNINKEQWVKLVDNLLSLMLRKRSKDDNYAIDDDIIEWLLDDRK